MEKRLRTLLLGAVSLGATLCVSGCGGETAGEGGNFADISVEFPLVLASKSSEGNIISLSAKDVVSISRYQHYWRQPGYFKIFLPTGDSSNLYLSVLQRMSDKWKVVYRRPLPQSPDETDGKIYGCGLSEKFLLPPFSSSTTSIRSLEGLLISGDIQLRIQSKVDPDNPDSAFEDVMLSSPLRSTYGFKRISGGAKPSLIGGTLAILRDPNTHRITTVNVNAKVFRSGRIYRDSYISLPSSNADTPDVELPATVTKRLDGELTFTLNYGLGSYGSDPAENSGVALLISSIANGTLRLVARHGSAPNSVNEFFTLTPQSDPSP